MDSTANRLQHLFFFALFIGSLVLVFFLLKSFISPLILAFALSIVFRPVYKRIKNHLGGMETLSALITVVLALIIVFVPLFFITQILLGEAHNLYSFAVTDGGAQKMLTSFAATVGRLPGGSNFTISTNLTVYIQQSLQWLIDHSDSFLNEFFKIAVALLIMTIAAFYILRDGNKFRDKYITMSPLPDMYDKKIIDTISSAVDSVIKGSLIIAVIQGIQGTIGVAIAGYSNPLVWGVLTAAASLIPGIGTGTVMIPAILYKFGTGHIAAAIILLVWYLLAITFIDNILSPIIMGRGIKIHPFLVLLGALGGVTLFGPIGLIAGPLIMAFFFALIDLYPYIIGRV
jgi:predicted PurR-regulated permease PerM